MLLAELVATSRRVADVSGRLDKIGALAQFIAKLTPQEIEIGVAFLSGETRQGRIGVGPALLREAWQASPASSTSLDLIEVDQRLGAIAQAKGSGSNAERARRLGELFGAAAAPEREFLSRLMTGELRQGALAGIVAEAVAKAAQLPASEIRRAAMLVGDLKAVARVALSEGSSGLARYAVTLFRPVEPMLAQPAEDVDQALRELGRSALEWKVDGARVQAHKSDRDVRVYTRNLNDVTNAVPEIVEALQALPARELILDGETIALKADGAPQPFQITMRRFGRKLHVERLRAELPLSAMFFDCLYCDGESLVDRPGTERFGTLAQALPQTLIVPRLVTEDSEQARTFFEDAIRRGHEGVMAKSLTAPYQAGSRGSAWLKVKLARTLDLVVLAAEWGNGRRKGWLSNLHLGARDPATGQYVMLGKTFKGMTDAMLTWQTQALQKLEIERDAYTVYVRPELVVEIAFNDLQASSQYPGGLALRFARVKRYRTDKQAADADTIDTVRAIFAAQGGAVRIED
jgi:DNA ligase 1